MQELDIPIFQKTYDLYKDFYACLKELPKYDRYSLGQKCELALTELMELLLLAGQQYKEEKTATLQAASVKLNLLRVYLRLAYEVKALNKKRYLSYQVSIDEVGRMLGGWLKSFR